MAGADDTDNGCGWGAWHRQQLWLGRSRMVAAAAGDGGCERWRRREKRVKDKEREKRSGEKRAKRKRR